MKTKRQQELINSFLTVLDEKARPVYREIIIYLSETGYHPKKEKSKISFKHSLHNKQIAKMGFTKGKIPVPYFALRFSACRDYSKRFSDIINDYIEKHPTREALCVSNGCSFCSNEAGTHVYMQVFSNGETKTSCGAYAVVIPDITMADIPEIKKLITEEHKYLLKHEAGIS